MIRMLSGDEAVARGAWEAGVAVASAYPGTPCTEILEEFARFPNVYAEWATNEKVAVDVADRRGLRGQTRPGGHEARRPERRRRLLHVRIYDRHRGGPGDRHRRRPGDALQPERAGQPHLRQVRPRPLPGANRQPGSQGPDRRRVRVERAVRHAGAAAADDTRVSFHQCSETGRRTKDEGRICNRRPASSFQLPASGPALPPQPGQIRHGAGQRGQAASGHRGAHPGYGRVRRDLPLQPNRDGRYRRWASSPAACPISTPKRSSRPHRC